MPVIILVLLTSIGVFVVYTFALPGFILFDDGHLDALGTLSDVLSKLNFVLSGEAGPIGRPVALATFLCQADKWPDDPGAMLRVNFVIHGIAIWAAFALAWGLALIRGSAAIGRAHWIAFAVAAIWGLSPFLATTHLMIIQRMTSLSGLFVLAGLAAFVWAHLLSERQPRLARLLLAGGLGLGTLLATLSKESGALLPLLALLILWLWVPAERRLTQRTDRTLLMLIVVAPCILLLGYLVHHLVAVIEHGYPSRSFTPMERLMAQPAILVDYLRNLLLPRLGAITPFMDHYPVPAGWLDPPKTGLSALVLSALLAATIWLRVSLPSFLFGFLFFLFGHLLESSFIGLELYFAHRNYLPAFGVYFGLVYAAATVPKRYQRLSVMSLIAVAMLFLMILWQVTSGWNQVGINAKLWVATNPHSVRAVQFLVNQYLQAGDTVAAQLFLDDAARRQPRSPTLQIQRTLICMAGRDEFSERLAVSSERLRNAQFVPSAAGELLRATTQVNPGDACPNWSRSVLAVLADALLDNPRYQRATAERAKLLATKGLVAALEDQPAPAIDLLVESFRLKADIDIAFFAGSIMSNAGRLDELQAFLVEVRQAVPDQSIERVVWLKRLDEFAAIVGVED